jgi:drug/metabolite transporter (DMT)-like permease
VASSALFAAMAVLAKVVSPRIPGPEIAFLRFALGAAVVGVAWAAGWIVVRPRRWRWLVSRGFFGGLSVLAYFAAIERIPVGVATLLNQTQPVFTMLFAWALLAERPRAGALAALPLTLMGVALIVGIRVGELEGGIGDFLGILSAIGSGLAVTSIRATRRELAGGDPSETAWSVFASFTIFGTLVTAPAALPPLGQWVSPTGREWALLLGVGALSVGAQLIMTEALRHLSGVTSGIISQLTVVLTIAAGWFFLGEPLAPWFLAGTVLCLAGVVLAILTASPRVMASRDLPAS